MVKLNYYCFRGIVVIITVVLVTMYYAIKITLSAKIRRISAMMYTIGCYKVKDNSLLDISDMNLQRRKSIFFHETSCNSYINGKITISSRQACSVESAARANPNLDVYLLYTSPGIIVYENTPSGKFLKALSTYKNVKIHYVEYERYTKGTPLEELCKTGKIESSKFSLPHASDLLRYLTLWKYGGTYIDLDTIVLKSFGDLAPNYAGAESDDGLNSAILGFDVTDQGHYFAQSCLDDLRHNFRGDIWAQNGPGVITRVLKNLCKVKTAKEMILKNCSGFTVYPPEFFYPVPYWKWFMYFDTKYNDEVMNLIKNSYVVHFWNNLSAKSKVNVTSDVPYSMLARRYCPKVFGECEEYF